MALIRLAYAADLPAPADVIKRLQGDQPPVPAGPATPPPAAAPREPVATAEPPPMATAPDTEGTPVRAAMGSGLEVVSAQPRPAMPEPPPPDLADYETRSEGAEGLTDFRRVVEFVHEQKEPLLAANLRSDVHLVSFAPGRIELRLTDHAERSLPQSLSRLLSERSGSRWIVSVSGEAGEPTLQEQDNADKASRLAQVEAHPMMRAVRESFPGAEIVAVRDAVARADGDE
jgi:DNA polymerase-3 subunit gamma/tau